MTLTAAERKVQAVQRRLLELGYVAGGEADGKLGKKTEATILDFRNRNNLPLRPTIDARLLKALAKARKIELPPEQIASTVTEIAPKVEAVSKTAEAGNASRWNKVSAWIVAVPSLVLSFASTLMEQFGPASNLIAPIKMQFSEVPWQIWLIALGVIAAVFALIAGHAQGKSNEAEKKLVEGYKSGQVSNDNREEAEAASPP